MIVRGDEVTLTKNELKKVIMIQGLFTVKAVEEFIKKIFGEER